MELSVAPTSLSIVFGIATIFKFPLSAISFIIFILPSPPITIKPSNPISWYPPTISAVLSLKVPSDIGYLKGFPLFVVPKKVPPCRIKFPEKVP